MGYEINFKYYKKKTEGFGFNMEGEPESLKVAVGSQWDEIDLDDVAKAIFGQMARRDIYIVDAEVFEYAKKKLNFKLKDDGISIKNKKYSYNITGSIKSEDDVIIPVAATSIALPSQPVIENGRELQPHELMQRTQRPTPVIQNSQQFNHDISGMTPEVQADIIQMHQSQAKRTNPNDRMRPILPPPGVPLRQEIYEPHPDIARAAKARGIPFTVGKRYPIFEEKPDPRGVMYGMIYKTRDDNGNDYSLNDKHFVPCQNLKTNYLEQEEFQQQHGPRLSYEGRGGDNGVVIDGKVVTVPDIVTLPSARRR